MADVGAVAPRAGPEGMAFLGATEEVDDPQWGARIRARGGYRWLLRRSGRR